VSENHDHVSAVHRVDDLASPTESGTWRVEVAMSANVARIVDEAPRCSRHLVERAGQALGRR
jgi:hypothetical protein